MGVFDFLKSLFGQQPEPVDVYLLLFSASWCGPSKRFIKEIKEGGINDFTLVDVETNEDLVAKYRIRNVPTTILMKKSGEMIKKWIGYDDKDPGQAKFVSFIKSGNYNILPYAVKSAPKQQAATPKPQPKPATPVPKPKPYEVKPFTFTSNQHQRYENGNPVMGVQDCMRSVSVEKNLNGCSGYQLKSGDGYIVKAMNLDANKPQMAPKPMRLVSHSETKDELRGYMVSAQTPFGWQDIDMSDYGLTIYYSNGKVSKVMLHMFDRNTDIEYRNVVVPKPATLQQPQQVVTTPFSKVEFERAIKTIAKMSYLFRDSTTLKSTGGGRNQKIMSTLHSYAGILGYLYQYTYKFGAYSDLVDQQMTKHFTLVAAAMSDSNHRQQSIKQLADNWSDVLQSVLYMQIDGTSEGNQMKALQAEIDFVTRMFETLSGSKCRKPKNEYAGAKIISQTIQSGRDKYSKMVDEANFNPFKITTNPSMQRNPPLPNNMEEVFKRELLGTYSNSVIRQALDDMQIFSSYVFNMVESYYNNAGYVPKTTVDAIIEQCYSALQQTQYASCIGSLEQAKDYIYYSLVELNR